MNSSMHECDDDDNDEDNDDDNEEEEEEEDDEDDDEGDDDDEDDGNDEDDNEDENFCRVMVTMANVDGKIHTTPQATQLLLLLLSSVVTL